MGSLDNQREARPMFFVSTEALEVLPPLQKK